MRERQSLLAKLCTLPGVQLLCTRRSTRWRPPSDRTRASRLDLVHCRRPRPAAYLVILSCRGEVIGVETFVSYAEAQYFFTTEGAPIRLPPAVAALLGPGGWR